MTRIATQLIRFRQRKIVTDLLKAGWITLSVGMITAIFLLVIEAVFWLSPAVRYGVWQSGLMLLAGVAVMAVVIGFLIRHNSVRRYRLETIAHETGRAALSKGDEIINALQLEKGDSGSYKTSRELADEFVIETASKLSSFSPTDVYSTRDKKKLKIYAISSIVLTALLIILFRSSFVSSAQRWIHPKTNFPVPHPYELKSITGDLSLMGGDNAVLQFAAAGKNLPSSIHLELMSDKEDVTMTLESSKQDTFTYELKSVLQNYRYRSFTTSTHFWEPWEKISSPVYRIDVTDRPTIEQFTATVIPPSYTGLSSSKQKGNIAEIRGIKGSQLGISLKTDKNLDDGYLSIGLGSKSNDRKIIPMTVNGRKATGSVSMMKDASLTAHVHDSHGIGNLDPIEYRLVVLQDFSPQLQVLIPPEMTELGSDFTIPINLHIEDDFGFSTLQIVYKIKHPEYLLQEESVSIHVLKNFSGSTTAQDIHYLWDVNELGLMPDDELQFHFEVYDNDVISGPKKAVSSKFFAKFPSLADLFVRTEEQEEEVQSAAEDMAKELEDLTESLKEMQLELLKDDKVEWEKHQVIEEALEKLTEKLQQIESLRAQMDTIIQEAEKHDLFSPDLLEKFQTLNDLLQDLMSPEMMAAMERMQSALEDVSQEDLQAALEDFSLNVEELESQLDRFIDIFERIQAEQQIDELARRMEQLAKDQEVLASQLESESANENGSRLAEDELRNQQEYKNLLELMAETAESIEPYTQSTSEELKEMAESELAQETSNLLEHAVQQLKQSDMSQGSLSAESASQNLQKMSQMMQSIQMGFQTQSTDEMAEKFRSILRKTLTISKEQERLQGETEDLPRNSPRLREKAGEQQLVKDKLTQLIGEMMELSHQTFAVSPEMGKAVGRAIAGMTESLSQMEKRNASLAANKQSETVAALNEAALATISAMDAMQQSGMASGMQQFMERMQQMSGQQQGINSQTLQMMMGQMSASAQQEMMRRLGQQQGQLKKSLQELINETRGSRQSGELQGIAEQMEEVLKDFRRKKVTRKTIERQERIMSRMLNSQKSLKQRDLSEKRKSRTSVKMVSDGPAGLPADLGQRRSLAIEALNEALKAGFSQDYQEMIRRYFNSLIQDEIVETNDE
jgi:hypothetical protein